jgi:hypothetical protein
MANSKMFRTKRFGNCQLVLAEYNGNKALAMQVVSYQGEPIARISVNIPGRSEHLPPNHFYLKDWSENQLVLPDILHARVIEHAGDSFIPATCGFEMAEVYKLVD